MNKHHGSKFDTYLKEKGTFEEISEQAEKRWDKLQTEISENASDITEDSPGFISRLFQQLRHAVKSD